jgi:hypothetical protein
MFPSKIANFITRKLTGVKLHDMNCGFKCYKRTVIENMNIYGDLYRYIPSIVNNMGFKVGEIKVKHHPRKHGKSKYGTRRLVTGFMDLLTINFFIRYTQKPLHFFGTIGFYSFLLGIISGIYLLYLKFYLGYAIGDRPLLILTILMIILGVQFFSMGFMAEMMTRNSKNKNYIISETMNIS